MSDRGEQIGRDAVDLLLQILEMPNPVVTAAAIETLGARRAAPLIELGLLKPAGHERSSASMSDHDDAPVNLTWPVTPAEVALCLIDLKLARLAHDPRHQDIMVDIAGYAAVLCEVTR